MFNVHQMVVSPTVLGNVEQCNGRGSCDNGFCHCSSEWLGADCSIPTISASLHQEGLVTMKRTLHRPLVFVYDLPPEFNSNVRATADLEPFTRQYLHGSLLYDITRTQVSDRGKCVIVGELN